MVLTFVSFSFVPGGDRQVISPSGYICTTFQLYAVAGLLIVHFNLQFQIVWADLPSSRFCSVAAAALRVVDTLWPLYEL